MNDVESTCEELLGMIPDDHALTGTRLRLKWLHEHFGHEPIDDISEFGVHQFTRAYILASLGRVMFADKSGNSAFPTTTVTQFRRSWIFLVGLRGPQLSV